MIGHDTALRVSASGPLTGRARLPGDKSISHRGLLLGALAEGTSRLRGTLDGNDCRATEACVASLGVSVRRTAGDVVLVEGRGLGGLRAPDRALDCGRSGTTMRLLCGLLAGQPFDSKLSGDPQLLGRPMARVVEPLLAMGAEIDTEAGGRPPLTLTGAAKLRGRDHALSLSSAQVKSALLLAGLYAEGPTIVRQPAASRDHTERALVAMGAPLEVSDGGRQVTLRSPVPALRPLELDVPGDPSSAAYPIVAATLVAGSDLLLEGVGTNPTRTGLLDALTAMGAMLTREAPRERSGEPLADLRVLPPADGLHGIEVGGELVVRMIDELPLLALVATQARGRTLIRDAAELRVKESDRIATTCAALAALGARITPRADGMAIEGPTPLTGGTVDSGDDHRLAMTLAVAGLVAKRELRVTRARCIGDSFPGFIELMRGLGAPLQPC